MEAAARPDYAMPRLNEPAPQFEANTTYGLKKLSDYKGKWLVLFSHPADFTPVCTTEFMAFATAYPEFQKLNCELLGLSIDSNYAHLAWVRNIKEKFGVDIPFPIIEDLSMQVAHAYGMIQPGASDTSAVRATFIIDDKGVLRAMVYYPMTNGRSIPEFICLVQALQTSDKHGVATPESWKPGDNVIMPAPKTAQDAEARMKEGYECADWYFCKKPLAAWPGRRESLTETTMPMRARHRMHLYWPRHVGGPWHHGFMPYGPPGWGPAWWGPRLDREEEKQALSDYIEALKEKLQDAEQQLKELEAAK